ncbi:TetR/AcrR family transcriptional regulator [Aeromicrobium senzhongii]|uniref:TetR/AcrR family transcriptional regulator n=1 Tax=Aeromicrobium senzhongii TaxID=2663859 RepID=A0ABX6SRQ0_9ACTN|nr:TetR/AcrR family transcriptional regulator [Aeromicrobium senzhongii]MTB88620.1 TetR family transcriptional regulator [Aeromicrobium senzhongii]QNL94073.1 TetR/AcrR family transcriptional regulator [Aeromicrobium senzhongii]
MSEQPSSRDRILAAASRLFAERGYDATSTRAIAEAVGLNIATVAYHVGGKSDLYREVMREAHIAQRDSVEQALTTLPDTESTPEAARAGLHAFIDAYLSFCVAHPDVPALWMRRWLAEGEMLSELESEFTGPLVERVAGRVRALLESAHVTTNADLDLLVYTIVWTTHAFSRAGVVDPTGTRAQPTDHPTFERFRRHLHDLVDGALSLPVA